MSQESTSVELRVKRIYDAQRPGTATGYWSTASGPAACHATAAGLTSGARDLAPGRERRRWSAHDPAKFDEFRARYRRELTGRRDRVRELGERASGGPITLVYAARDELHNKAVLRGGPARPAARSLRPASESRAPILRATSGTVLRRGLRRTRRRRDHHDGSAGVLEQPPRDGTQQRRSWRA